MISIINDEHHLLDLDHTEIYLMLTTEEKLKYSNKLKEINLDATLTKGLFHFDIVEKGEAFYDKIPEDVMTIIRFCNVMVRLINSTHGDYSYGVAKINLDNLVPQLKTFVEKICKEDIRHLEILSRASTSISTRSHQYYIINGVFKEVFEEALKLTSEDCEEARRLLKEVSDSVSRSASHNLVQSLVNGQRAILDQKWWEKNAPDTRPEILIEIKHDVVRVTKKGREGEGTGVEIRINGNTRIPISFGVYSATFLYMAILWAQKEGKKISRHDFTKSLNSEEIVWLENVYNVGGFSKEFETFLLRVQDKELKPITDAKDIVNRVLWEALPDQYKEAYHYLCISKVASEYINRSKYYVNLEEGQITIDETLCKRYRENVEARDFNRNTSM